MTTAIKRQFIRIQRATLTLLIIALPILSAVKWAHARIFDRVEGRGLDLGRTLLQGLLDLSSEEQILLGVRNTLLVNGAKVHLQTAAFKKTEGPTIAQLTQSAVSDCRKTIEVLGESQAMTHNLALSERPIIETMILEKTTKEAGFVFCLKPKFSFSAEGSQRMLEDFGQSGSLNDFGRWQGMYVESRGNVLHMLTVEISEGLVPAHMFPDGSDCPGDDMAELPRPKARRTLSVTFEGRVSVTQYIDSQSPEHIIDSYTSELGRRGLKIHTADPKLLSNHNLHAFVVQSAQDTFVVSAHGNASESALTVARLPR